MIRQFGIDNFKSIRSMNLACRRINIFIGRPNVGKSNILEALGSFSAPRARESLKNIMRLESMTDLFYDQDTSRPIQVRADQLTVETAFKEGKFYVRLFNTATGEQEFRMQVQYDSSFQGGWNQESGRFWGRIRFYRFETQTTFPNQQTEFLLPPLGENLLVILQTHTQVRRVVSDLLAEFGLQLVFKPQEKKLEVAKKSEDVIISYPYSLVSDTLQRIIFYYAAIATNEDAILVFEEPESHAFPYYTKFLAEKIAEDTRNQYFLSTHNPYLLSALVEKAKREDVGIFVTYFQNYETKARRLSEKEVREALSLDESIFFNLDRYTEKQ